MATRYSGEEVLPRHPIVSDPDGARDVDMSSVRLIGHNAVYLEGSVGNLVSGGRRLCDEDLDGSLFAIYDDRENDELPDGAYRSPQKAFVEQYDQELEDMLLSPYRRELLVLFPASAFDELGDPRSEIVEEAVEGLLSSCIPLYDATGVVLDGLRYPKAAFMPGDVSLSSDDEANVLTLKRQPDGGSPLYKEMVFGTLMSQISAIAEERLPRRPVRGWMTGGGLSVDNLSATCRLLSLGRLSPFHELEDNVSGRRMHWHAVRPSSSVRRTRFEAKIEPGEPFLNSNLAAAEAAAKALPSLITIWEACAQGVMSLECPSAVRSTPDMLEIYIQFADAIGAKPLIHAICSGVSIDDILGSGDNFVPAWRVSLG